MHFWWWLRFFQLTCVSINIPTYDDEGNAILIVKQMYFIPEFGIEDKEQ
ncbi:hypothetical protein [Bacillus sp. FSL R9-9497]